MSGVFDLASAVAQRQQSRRSLGADTCTKLIDQIFALEKMKDIRALRHLLQRT
jgi:hypothetical protein